MKWVNVENIYLIIHLPNLALVQKLYFVYKNREKNWKWFQKSALAVNVSMDGTSVKSFHIGPTEQAAKFEA